MEQVPSDEDYVQVNAIITRKRREALKRKAAKAGMTYSAFVSAMIASTQVVAKVDKKAELQRLNAWLGRINSNLNMLSKHANTYKEGSDTALIQLRLTQIRDEIRELVGRVAR
ncbi:plasmid mobilization protein [Pseudomonas putida]|uniref:plasmid mobilization protein n=1 Tax=Pseudomonas putida TaxID=303 RepID=UPI000750F255|nr:hypothetical protein [Pseudomonas putida]